MLTVSLLHFSLLVTVPEAIVHGYREASVYDNHATLEIPADWNEIPREVLEFYSLRAAEASGGLMTETYQYGYRPGDPEMDFALPQFLIQIRESGRLNYRQFLHLPTPETMRVVGERALAERAGPFVRDLELGEAVFDLDSYSLRLSNTLDLSFEGETSVESVAFFTERGLFTIHFYAHASEVEALEPVFRRVAESVRFDQALQYHPRFTDRWPPRASTILLAAAAMIGAAAFAVHLLQRRRSTS